MIRLAVLFGGAGYIGTFLIKRIIEERLFDKILIYDLQEPGRYADFSNYKQVSFRFGDVRNFISASDLGEFEPKASWIFNFAAVHREPGHSFHEYFDTNIPGAQNVCDYAERSGLLNILFTSSIAPYGKSPDQRDENSNLYPETAYGISKGYAEKIHQIWLAKAAERRLVIVRPSVIYGPKDPGNVYRMIKSIKRGTFILPGGGEVIKAYGYIYGLTESMIFVMAKNEKFVLYNYSENPLENLRAMTQTVKSVFGYKRWVPQIPVPLLAMVAFLIQLATKVLGKKSDIHPVRVRKAGFPTNIRPTYLIDQGFIFNYDFPTSLEHWRAISPSDFDNNAS